MKFFIFILINCSSYFFLSFKLFYLNPLAPGTWLERCYNQPIFEQEYLKTVRANIAFTGTIFKEYSISFLMISGLLVFKVCGIIVISKIHFLNFSGGEKVNVFRNLTGILTVVSNPILCH